MKKSKLVSILAFVLVFSLASCDLTSTNSNKSSEETTTDTETSPADDSTSGSINQDILYQTYYWVPQASQFGVSSNNISAGTLTHNGLTWSYTEVATHFSDDTDNSPSKGLHIGSKNNPQTSGWTLSTDFGENVTLTSFSIVLSVGSGGSTTYTIKADNQTVGTDKFTNTSPEVYELSELDIECSSLSINLVASSSAFYLKSITIGLITNFDSSLHLTMDEDSDGILRAGFTPQATKYSATTDLDTLYAPITDSMGGETLRVALREISSVKTKYTYGDLRNNLLYTDQDPNNSNYLYGDYDGAQIIDDWDYGTTWNREHVWPCAHMSGINEKSRPDKDDKGPYTDMHNIRASSVSANSLKADYFVGNSNQSNCFYVNTGEGDHRGDTARILLYMYTEYDGLILSDDQNSKTDVTYGYLSTILQWNIDDPVDAFERQRNNRIEEYQGNRNPFIDHPEYAERLFN